MDVDLQDPPSLPPEMYENSDRQKHYDSVGTEAFYQKVESRRSGPFYPKAFYKCDQPVFRRQRS